MSIPLFIIEEHHEAFIVWNYAIMQGWIPSVDNCLFHVDEHSDMGTPRFNRSIHNNKDIEDVINFTYGELNIASFIIPACYLGIFDEVYWIRQKHNKITRKPREMYVRSYNQSGKRIISGKEMKNEGVGFDPDRKVFDYYLRTIDHLPSEANVILDIDLDFFSCAGNPNELEEIYVEITEDEYRSFEDNKYHRLNYGVTGRVEALEKDGKYYYVFNNYNEIYPSECKVPEEEIIKRVDSFVDMLRSKNIKPSLVSICRSRHSGYTPADQWEMIESYLVSKLRGIYELKDHTNSYEKAL